MRRATGCRLLGDVVFSWVPSNPFPETSDGKVALVALAGRCLREPASRRLDGEIYCALHNIRDINDLSDRYLLEARENGEVLASATRRRPRMDTGAAFH